MEEELVPSLECRTSRALVRKNFRRNFEYQRCSATGLSKHRFYIAQRESARQFLPSRYHQDNARQFGSSCSLESARRSVKSEAVFLDDLFRHPALFKIAA